MCTESGFANGVHWWSVTKMLRSHAGEKGRLGVVVMDTELDTDLKKDGSFKGRAFFITEDGNLWDGDCFVSKGVDFGTAGYVVTMRLDCYTGELTFWVASKGWCLVLTVGFEVEVEVEHALNDPVPYASFHSSQPSKTR